MFGPMPRIASPTAFGGKAGNPINRTIPGTGRPTSTFTKRMAYLRDLYAKSDRWLEIAKGAEVPAKDFLAAAREVFDRSEGRPQQAVDVTSGGQPLTLTADERRAELAALLGLDGR